MVKRFTTLVIATSPTFWLKEVMGRQPNTEDRALIKPSHASEPEISRSVASRFRPEVASAHVSPMVSVADTRKISTTDRIALALNSGLKGIREGNATIEVPSRLEKSTIPIQTATR